MRTLCKDKVKQIDQIFSMWNTQDSPGAAVAVLQEGEVIFSKGYGSAQLEYQVPITPQTIFHVASVSKQFTAMAIALLAHEGKISLDDDVRMYIPEVPQFEDTITIRHLVHHTSGLRDQWELLAMAGWRMDDVITHEHIMKMVEKQEDLNFTPGEKHLYCNTGYTLMAEIVERVSGKTFVEFTQENIFAPLGMKDTHFHDDHEMIVPNRAYSYKPTEDGYKKSVLSYANVGATSLFTTTLDLAKWAHNFYCPKVGNDKVMDIMHQQFTLNNGEHIDYAFGQAVGEFRGVKTVSHGGADAGFKSHLLRFPELKSAVIILSNLSTFRPDSMAEKVAAVVFSSELMAKDASTVEPKARKHDAESECLDKYVGNYVLSPGRTINLELKDDGLVVTAMGIPQINLQPLGKQEFLMTGGLEGKLGVELNEDGSVKCLDLSALRKGTKAYKVEQQSLSATQLQSYTGTYYSSELGNTYEIVVDEGQLVLKHRRKSDIELIATNEDQFDPNSQPYGWGRMNFVRDEDDQITGFRLTGGRVLKLQFKRLG